jgi:hypothetical protein
MPLPLVDIGAIGKTEKVLTDAAEMIQKVS